MKTILASLLTILLFLPVLAVGEIQTVTHTVKQSFGGSQSPDDARISAVAKAKREALEMAGTYIESLTVVKNSQVDKDEILALAAGVLKAEVVSQKNYHTEDAFGIDVVVRVVVDTSVLEERVKKLLQDKTHLTQLKDAQKRETALLQKVAQLEQENKKLMAKNQSTQELKKEFQQASRGLTAVDWVNQALALLDGGKNTDPKKAIEYLNNAIKLQPDFAFAYGNRGVAYNNLGQYQRAIEDYNEFVRLQPDDAKAYYNRGHTYANLDQYQRAIEDYNEAIRLKPDYADAYKDRGQAYSGLGQYQRAIEDYNKAVRINPEYTSRSLEAALNMLKSADDDFEAYRQTVRINPKDAGAWYNIGIHLDVMDRYNDAIEAYRQTVRINPEYAEAWYNLGATYGRLKRYDDAIEAYRQALRIDPKGAKARNAYANHRYDDTFDAYRQALRIGPEHAEAWYNLGIIYDSIIRYDDAIDAYRQALRINPEYASAWYSLGIAYYVDSKPTAAMYAVKELRRLDPERAEELFNLIVPR